MDATSPHSMRNHGLEIQVTPASLHTTIPVCTIWIKLMVKLLVSLKMRQYQSWERYWGTSNKSTSQNQSQKCTQWNTAPEPPKIFFQSQQTSSLMMQITSSWYAKMAQEWHLISVKIHSSWITGVEILTMQRDVGVSMSKKYTTGKNQIHRSTSASRMWKTYIESSVIQLK